MKLSFGKRGMALLLGMLMALVLISPALAASKTRVFVEYKDGQKAAVKAALTGARAEFHYTFDDLNSFVVSVPEQALKGLKNNPRIASIEVDPERYLVPIIKSEVAPESILEPQTVPYGVDMVQARNVWDVNRDEVIDADVPTGEGITVCIIDTGLYTAHEDFSGVNVAGGYSQTNDDSGLWTYDGYGHGTHVAGTITADIDNQIGVVGVTPGTASLYIVKIFGDDGEWVRKAHASDLIKAANMCAENGAKIISMSLGGSQASKKEEKAFDALYAADVLSIAAAGNEQIETPFAYSYPASYDSVVSVAAINEAGEVAEFSLVNDQVELAAPGVGVLSTIPYIDPSKVTVDGRSYSAAPVEFAPLDTKTGELIDGELCMTTGDWVGKVVLCSRGTNTFYEKVMNVQNSGGVAAVIYNNEDGMVYATLGEGNSSTIVAVGITMADGLSLLSQTGYTATVEAAEVIPGSGYEAWDGTSMATPHVSGVAALIWSANPGWTNAQVREAMVATAVDLGPGGCDPEYGWGLVQAKAALDYLLDQ